MKGLEYYSITADMWSSGKMKPYLDVTIHFINIYGTAHVKVYTLEDLSRVCSARDCLKLAYHTRVTKSPDYTRVSHFLDHVHVARYECLRGKSNESSLDSTRLYSAIKINLMVAQVTTCLLYNGETQ